MRKIKVLHLSSELTWRGGEQQMAYLLQDLPALGIENIVACRKNSAFETYCRQVGQLYYALPFANELDLYSAIRIRQICHKHHIDIVHAHSGHSHALAVWSHLLGNKRPIVLHRRVDFPVRNNLFSTLKYNYTGIERIICVSDAVKNILAPALQQPEKCTTIYDGIDLNRFANPSSQNLLRTQFHIPAHLPIVANIAALTTQKDYHTFINTVARLVELGVEAAYFIIGQGPLEQELKAYATEKKVQDHIIFTGFRNDINLILPELDVLLFTSQTEGLGSTILDAMACQVPIVSTNAGGIPELISQNQTGLLANVGDAEMLAQHVQTILQQPQLAATLRSNARAVVEKFSKTETARQTAALYQRLLS